MQLATVFGAQLGVTTQVDRATLMQFDAATLLAAQNAALRHCSSTIGLMAFQPVYGDDTLPEHPFALLRSNDERLVNGARNNRSAFNVCKCITKCGLCCFSGFDDWIYAR